MNTINEELWERIEEAINSTGVDATPFFNCNRVELQEFFNLTLKQVRESIHKELFKPEPKTYGLPRPIPARGAKPDATTAEQMQGISDHLALIKKGLEKR